MVPWWPATVPVAAAPGMQCRTNGYVLQHLPSHLRTADEAAWRELLLDPRWIARKLTALGTTALVADYEPVVEDELRLIGAMRCGCFTAPGGPLLRTSRAMPVRLMRWR